MNIGERIREIRKSKNLLQSDLAEKAGISRVAIGNYERGDRVPNADILSAIAIALNVPISDLIIDPKNISEEKSKIDKKIQDNIIKLIQYCGFQIEKEYDNDGYGDYLRYIYISFNEEQFRLRPSEFYDMSKRILDSITINVLASQHYNKLDNED